MGGWRGVLARHLGKKPKERLVNMWVIAPWEGRVSSSEAVVKTTQLACSLQTHFKEEGVGECPEHPLSLGLD